MLWLFCYSFKFFSFSFIINLSKNIMEMMILGWFGGYGCARKCDCAFGLVGSPYVYQLSDIFLKRAVTEANYLTEDTKPLASYSYCR